MKKGFLLFLLGLSFVNAEVIYKNREYKFNSLQGQENTKKQRIKFSGVIMNIKDYRDYYQYTIKDKDNGLIYIRLNSKMFKEKGFVSGICEDKNYSDYIHCSILDYRLSN